MPIRWTECWENGSSTWESRGTILGTCAKSIKHVEDINDIELHAMPKDCP